MKRLLVATLLLMLVLTSPAWAEVQTTRLADDQLDVAVRVSQFAELIVENPRGLYFELDGDLHILNLTNFLENPDYEILWDVTIRSNADYIFTAEENLSSRFYLGVFANLDAIDTWWQPDGAELNSDYVIAPQVDLLNLPGNGSNEEVTAAEVGSPLGTVGSGEVGRYSQFASDVRNNKFILRFSAPVSQTRFDELAPGLYEGIIYLTLDTQP